jgi:hypothetical protein
MAELVKRHNRKDKGKDTEKNKTGLSYRTTFIIFAPWKRSGNFSFLKIILRFFSIIKQKKFRKRYFGL